ncbi:restriction endonuclease subunit S [Stutzerimonas kunmingensis]|uniref:restriction endonuclease subunit S n=1 Tax=Stutzerimonas kunmingensis TaxID=1211807 RepID=UPI00241C8ABB|nr:restriction endonuclease subunit S [Stutzerimonas kunmingensis]
MSELPNTWVDVEIGEIAEVIGGGTPKVNDAENFTTPGHGIAWLTPADLSGYKPKEITRGARDLTSQGYQSSSAKLMPKGSLLFSSRAPIGYVAVAANEIATNQGFKSFVFSDGVVPDYAFYYLKSIRQLADSLGTGTTFKELSGATAKTLPFRLAPTAEQTRIAAKLDELLAQVDTLKARIDGIPALLKRFRQSVLAAAVSGRLTEEWRVQNCPTPPKAPSPNKYSLSMEELKTFADLHNLPHRWECASAAQICSSVRDGTHDTPAYHLSGIPLVTSKNIGSGFVDTTEAKLISIEDHLEISKRSLVEHGDVLFSMIGTVGNCCVVREQDSEFSIKNVGLFKKNESVILPRFLEFWLNSQVMWSWLEKNLKGSSQKFASLGTLRALPVFLPSLQEQTEIVRRVEQLFAFADQLEAKVASAKSRIDHLTQSILAKAFRGELVPQDPNDEPASVLLARIKAQRAAAPRAKRGRRAATPS